MFGAIPSVRGRRANIVLPLAVSAVQSIDFLRLRFRHFE